MKKTSLNAINSSPAKKNLFIQLFAIIGISTLITACGNVSDPAPKTLWEEKLSLWCNESKWSDADRVRFAELTLKILPGYYKTGELNSPWKSPEMMELYNKNNVKYHVDNCKSTSNSQSSSSTSPATQAVVILDPLAKFDGLWHFNEGKSRAANASADDMTRAIIDATLLGLTLESANSAGMKIQSGQVQDGSTRCTLEATGNAANAPVNCVKSVDRSIAAQLSILETGDLQFKTSGMNIIFEKK